MNSSAKASSDGLWCVLLSAGESRRLGYPKQLVRDPVRPLLLRALDAAQAVVQDRIVVVLGAHRLRLRTLLARNNTDVRIVSNAHWKDGIASSLRAGVGAVPSQARGVLIVLTDQPGVSAWSLGRLASAWRRQPARAVAAGYGGGFGVPAILPRRLLLGVNELDGDVGAKALLSKASSTLVVDMPEAGFDVDTSEDLLLVARNAGQRRFR